MKFMNQIRRYVAAGTLAVTLTIGAATTAHAWTINGQDRPDIPFWYTLKEAVCAALWGTQGCEDAGW